MNVVGALRQIILDDTNTVALLADATSVYPVIVPQEKTMPAIVLTITGLRPNDSKTHVSPIDNVSVLVESWAKEYNTAQQIDAATRNAVDGFSGGVETSDTTAHYIDAVRLVSVADGYDPNNKLFVRTSTYDVRYYRDIPPLPFGTPYVSQSTAWANALPMWNSDEEAKAGGVDERGVTRAAMEVGEIYICGPDCSFATFGTFRIVAE